MINNEATEAFQCIAATDDLFQTFLESMQAHTTAREVFDIIREFALNCTNMLDVIQETAGNEVCAASNAVICFVCLSVS